MQSFSLVIYDEYINKIFIIAHGKPQFDKTYGWALIGITNENIGLISDHEYFCIH